MLTITAAIVLILSAGQQFWADIEKHHPSIDTLHLPLDVADAWKQRLRLIVSSKGNAKPRRFYLTHLVTIRGFYLDIAEWALEDPTCAQWAVPCPIRRGETDGLTKEKRKVAADMHQRIRERLPHLDTIVDAVDSHRRAAAELLAAASSTDVGSTFQHADDTYSRVPQYKVQRAARHMNEPAVIVERVDTGDTHDATKSEADAFWSWAVVETLRHTGVRLEELLEITQLAVVQYQLADTGETVWRPRMRLRRRMLRLRRNQPDPGSPGRSCEGALTSRDRFKQIVWDTPPSTLGLAGAPGEKPLRTTYRSG